MKAQFKYAFRAGLNVRLTTFAIIFTMNLVFIILNIFGALPFAGQVTAVSLGGVAIAVMMVVNVIGDVSIVSRMFSAPGAYLHALTPAPRRQILLAGVITMMIKDIVTMTVVITSEVILSLQLAGDNVISIVWTFIRSNTGDILYGLLYTSLLIVGYMFVMMIIMFCITVNKSIFYQKRLGGLMTGILAVAVCYVFTLSSFLIAPFGTVQRIGMNFMITAGTAGSIAYIILILAQAAILFILTSKLMERKVNI